MHLDNPREVVPESNMPGFPWLAKNKLNGATVQRHMRGLRAVGDPYSEEDIAGAPKAVEGRTEQDALVAYLQGLGRHAPKGE